MSNIFENIRKWSSERGIPENATEQSQFIKLIEETGELSEAILKGDRELFIDSIGDCIVVLTILAQIKGINVEECIESAYNEIKDRKGKMINGTFVKNK
jgi:NTP pyrophosphatase (non-canonical NTP hydrolase)